MPAQVTTEDVQRMVSEGAQLVEVLPAKEYEREHLPGAVNIPLKTLDRWTVRQLDPNRPVIVYCDDYQ